MRTDIQPKRFMQAGFVQPKPNRPTAVAGVRRPAQTDRPDRQYVMPEALDIRFHRWLRSWVVLARDYDKDNHWPRFVHRNFWVFGYRRGYSGLYERGRQLTIALLGGRTVKTEAAERMAICRQCPDLTIKLPRRTNGDVRYYCGSCSCPRWFLSELRIKNRLRLWRCPKRRHPGTYPDERIRRMIATEREHRGVKTDEDASTTGCVGAVLPRADADRDREKFPLLG